MAEISESTYKDWADTFYKASTAIVEREQKLEEAAELIEKVNCVTVSEWQSWFRSWNIALCHI